MKQSLPKIIVILGPTASGKSDLAVALAQKYHGEVISADSRQVYKGLNIGTGKITKKEMKSIKHHMLDVASPSARKKYSVQDYKKQAEKIILDIIKRKKVPIICGGTGFYIQALVDNVIFPEVPPNLKLRKELLKKTEKERFIMLAELDIRRATTIDLHNPQRVIRAIEIATYLGNVPPLEAQPPSWQVLQIGIKTDDTKLREKIHTRLLARIKAGMIKEAQKLHKQGLSWKKMEELGLEYKYLALYLQKKKPFDSAQGEQIMTDMLETEIWHYAKRQKTWFKKDTRIKWFSLKEEKKIEKEISKFLK